MRGRDYVRTATIPIRVQPQLGESFSSWLWRYAERLRLSAGQLIVELTGGDFKCELLDVEIDGKSALSTAYRAGLNSAILDAMHLSAFDRGPLSIDAVKQDPATGEYRRQWILSRRSRVCPLCVAESGVWQLEWQLAISFVCLSHSVLLLDSCTSCQWQFRRLQRSLHGAAELPFNSIAQIHSCNRCREPFGRMPVIEASDDMLAAQAELARWTEVRGRECSSPSELFRSLYSLAALLLMSVDPADVGSVPDACQAELSEFVISRDRRTARRQASTQSYRRPIESAGLAAAILPIAVRELRPEYRSRNGCGLIEELGARIWRDSSSRRQLVEQRLGLPPDIQCRLETSYAQFEHVTLKTAFRDSWPTSDASFDIRFVPQVLPAELCDCFLTETLVGTRSGTRRALGAFATARIALGGSWDEAAAALHVDERNSRKMQQHLSRRVKDAKTFWASVWACAQALALEAVDYRSREERLIGLDIVDADWWEQARTAYPMSTDPAVWRNIGAAWIWEHYVLGNLTQTFSKFDARYGFESPDISGREFFDGYRSFSRWLPSHLKKDLLNYAIGFGG